jgi:hypothetical protein
VNCMIRSAGVVVLVCCICVVMVGAIRPEVPGVACA